MHRSQLATEPVPVKILFLAGLVGVPLGIVLLAVDATSNIEASVPVPRWRFILYGIVPAWWLTAALLLARRTSYPRFALAINLAATGFAALILSHAYSQRTKESWWEGLWLELGAALLLGAVLDLVIEVRRLWLDE